MGLPTIYFVQVDRPDGPVKIGYTGRRVGARMAEGQTFSPLELEVLVEAYGTYEDEAHLHRIFKPYHIRGGVVHARPDVEGAPGPSVVRRGRPPVVVGVPRA